MDACKLTFFDIPTSENIMLTLIRMSNTHLDTCTMDTKLLNTCNLGYLWMLEARILPYPSFGKYSPISEQ